MIPQAASGARPVPRVWSAGLGAVALLVYLWLAPGVPGAGDAGEFALVLAMNGVAHPTGYPLYTLFGHLFVVALRGLGHGRVGWAFAANAWSAVGGGLAIALMHAFAARWIAPAAPRSRRARALIALLPVMLFALNPAWTSETTVAEVHAWHVAWVMGVALAFLGLVRAGDDGAAARANQIGRAAGWGFLCGVGLAHHATAVLVAVPLSLALLAGLARTRTLAGAPLMAALFAALLPLSSYGLIYLKALHPSLAVWAHLEPSWPAWLEHVTGAQYRGFLGRFHPSAIQVGSLDPYVYPFVFPWLPLLALVALRARGAERLIGLGLGGAAALQVVFVLAYGVPDPSSYFLPAMAIGLCALAPLGAGLAFEGARARRLAWIAGAALALFAVALAGPWLEVGRVRREGLAALERRVRQTWASVPFERGVVLWGDDMFHRLHAYQLLDGEKPEVLVLNPVELLGGPARRRFIARLGFDPLEDVAVPATLATLPDPEGPEFQRFISDVGRRIEAGTGLPVARFDLRRREAVLVGPAAPAAGAPRP